MHIGFGSTVWVRGLFTGHLDGIGVYTERLWHEYAKAKVNDKAFAFGVPDRDKFDPRMPQPLEYINGSYMRKAATSLATGFKFRGVRRLDSHLDVFHATDQFIPKLRRVPLVSTVMDAIPLVRPDFASSHLRFIKNQVLRRTALWSDHIITISEFSKRDIVDAFGINERNITVIPLGYDESFRKRVDDAARRRVLKEYGLKEGFFIFVGTLQPRKNVRRIIAAHRSLNPSIKARHPMVFVGNYGWNAEDVLRDIEQMQCHGHGRWLGFVPHDDLRALMQSAKALVYPSLYEGFGLPVLEGFAAGIPVITSNTTSIPEVAGDAALLVNPYDTDAIAQAMLNVTQNEHLAYELVQRGNARLEKFSWHSCAKSTLEVYKKIV